MHTSAFVPYSLNLTISTSTSFGLTPYALAMYFDELPCTLCWDFQDMASDFQRAYEEVFGELPDDIADKI